MTPESRQKITGEVQFKQELRDLSIHVRTIEDFQKLFASEATKSTSQAIAALLASAISLDASDIHMEPEEEHVRLRFRIDGLLQNASSMGLEQYQSLLSRIKLVSGIKMNVSDRPQDGRFTVDEEHPTEIRVSTLPSEYGETTVMRVLNPNKLLRLEDLGLREDLLEIFQKELRKPNGMILITGPTGSGKTTTLYAFLTTIQKPEIKIITIEDPIEYHLPDISQTQVDPEQGYDFASGLRAIVRQDPDVILVGEIRDTDTANIALQASLTGHLVFSTLHTNDSAGTFSRLTSLGADPSNIAPAINLAIAQRLVRTICGSCKEERRATPEEAERIRKAVGNLPSSTRPALKQTIYIPTPKGCPLCNNTGYKGRIGIFEAIELNDALRDLLLTSPSASAVKKAAHEHGLVPMYEDGILKVLEGTTTLEEVERVTMEDS